MNFIKKNRRIFLTIILYCSLFLLGQRLFELLNYGLDNNRNIYIQLSGLISFLLLALGCFWELYFTKSRKKKYK